METKVKSKDLGESDAKVEKEIVENPESQATLDTPVVTSSPELVLKSNLSK